ncbi:MAG: prepilin-type N-terminal cleavage/methylation domain-containing protein [Phycisphaerales bacterium]|nr:MAG: prepilin-type N-terminal cleavage/methylation domain-containing protein [Phycisphaerales bacterium]
MTEAVDKRRTGGAGRGDLACSGTASPRGFTLAELITVMAIVVVLLAVALPTVQNFNLAGQFSQMQATMASLTTAAMIPSYEQTSGLLVMRARKRPAQQPGPNVDPEYDNPALNYQEVRVVTRAPYPDPPAYVKLSGTMIDRDDFTQQPFYRMADRSAPTRLAELTWLAPDYVTATRPGGFVPELDDGEFANERLADPYTEMFPAGGGQTDDESLVNAFFLLYCRGEVVREPPGPLGENLAYSFVNNTARAYIGSGSNLAFNPQGMIKINHSSARGAYVYERGALLDITRTSLSQTAEDRRNYLREEARVLYSARFGGDLVEGSMGEQ